MVFVKLYFIIIRCPTTKVDDIVSTGLPSLFIKKHERDIVYTIRHDNCKILRENKLLLLLLIEMWSIVRSVDQL